METVKGRRSVKQRFMDRTVEDGVLERLLDAAIWAPSAHNSQPWSFVVIRDNVVKRRLAEKMALAWRRDFHQDSIPHDEREKRIAASIDRVSNAPLLIIVCLAMEHMHRYTDERRQKCEYIMAVQSVAAAVQNLLLAAHESNLGSCWMCAPLFSQEAVRQVLGIPTDMEPQALVTLGYFEGSIEAPPRQPISKVVHMDRW
jgi:coenzyme F420-0:L-glutamate ligase/coenzyme F420-1:gamma-L-glutamate ligase